jgi:RNA polymerase sigma-70 factor (sigma-E family)
MTARTSEAASAEPIDVACPAPRAARNRARIAQARITAAHSEHASGLGRLAFLLTGDQAVAEDLVQEAFVRAFARFGYLRSPDALGAYLRRTIVNLAGKHHQRRRRERALSMAAPSSPLAAVGRPDVESRELLWAALQQLPHRQRAALVLRFYGDLSERDAAAVLGCRAGTVKSLVHRGLAAMREELGVREHE